MMSLEKWLKLLLIIIFFVIIIQIIRLYNKPSPVQITTTNATTSSTSQCNDNKCIKNENKNGTCGEGCKSCDSLLPVLDPRFNMREICKQSVLLEDHLFQKEKRCHDCICKHFLTIEALAEEAITLDKDLKHPEINVLPTKVRTITKKYIDNHTNENQPPLTAQQLREIRKDLMQKCFKYF